MITLERRMVDRVKQMAEFGVNKRQKETLMHCPLCRNISFQAHPVIGRFREPLSVSWCMRCGLEYLNPRMTAAEYGEFYKTLYRDVVKPTPQIADAARQQNQTLGQKIASQIVQLENRPKGAILDIGCGDGVVTSTVAQQLDCEAVGLDPNPGDCEKARQLGVRVVEGSFENLPTGAFAGVLCVRTLDHVLNPLRGLKAIKKLIAPGGWLWVDVVDTNTFRRNRHPLEFWKLDHPFYWTDQTLKTALYYSGWQVIEEQHRSRKAYSVLARSKEF